MASTSSSTQFKTWDVFISFRGKDTRGSLLSHLDKAMKQKQINAFIDDKLRKGEEICEALLKVIEDSHVSVVIFSENYADSSWCLDELEMIAECRGKSGQIVLPVFYKVDPTDVQELTGSFGKAFHKLKEKFQGKKKMDGWSQALDKVSNLSGYDSINFKLESEFVKEIVKGISENLNRMLSNNSYGDKLVGIDFRVKEVESLLQIGLVNDHRTIGIWGMGGIGKTTIANAIFTQNMTQFDSSYFVTNVREELNNQAPIKLRDRIISYLLGEKDLHINTPHLPIAIRRRFQRMKVIIVFDDVHDPHLLNLLAGNCHLFNKGSRIIVTSRDRQVFKNVCPTKCIYEVTELIYQEALQLFSLYAFKQNHPKEGYLDLSMEAISYAQGNPLALTVLGSNLYDKDMEEWGNELKKLKNIPDMKIQEVLKISYDVLDRNEKSIFLDIACFFQWMHEDEVERILECFDFFPKIGMSRLVDKSLISVSTFGFVEMHDLVRQMGKDIVYEECKQPKGRSRLWNAKDISHVLTEDKGTEKVESISLNLLEISGRIVVSSTAFKKMCNLRFFKLCRIGYYSPDENQDRKLLLPNGLEYLPKELRYLEWEDYPLESLPLKFCSNLVELHMVGSQLKQLWNGDVLLANLKFMDLSHSAHLIRIPKLSGALNLEILMLEECKSLVEIPSSLQYLSKLIGISLKGCTNLCSFPSCLHLKNLDLLNLKGCSKLRKCPEIPCNVEILYLDETAIEALPSSVEHCSQLIVLSLMECKRLVSLPHGICNLKFLEFLHVNGCSNLKALPDNLGDLKSLKELNVSRSGIEALPSSINQLTKLEKLYCSGCHGLTTLPLLIGLACLSVLDLSDCGITEIPESIKLLNLKHLLLTNCKRLGCSLELACLERLHALNCFSLKSVSTPFLSSRDHEHHYYFANHKFFYCINLDCEVKMDLYMESRMVKQIRLRFPKAEASEGMRYQNKNGSSVSNIRLDGRRIIGFSLCLVVDPKILFDGKLFTDFTFNCIASFEDESGHSFDTDFKFTYDHDDEMKDIIPQHLFLWCEKNIYSKEHLTLASFRLYTTPSYHSNGEGEIDEEEIDNKAIIMCGIHIIYEDDCKSKDKKRRRNDDQNEDEEDLPFKRTRKDDRNMSLSPSSLPNRSRAIAIPMDMQLAKLKITTAWSFPLGG